MDRVAFQTGHQGAVPSRAQSQDNPQKLEAAGVDFDNVFTFDTQQFGDVHKGVDHIEAVMEHNGVELVILDPLNHYLPMGTDGHKDSSFSQAIRSLTCLR